jgi:hypothetical protein
LIFGSPCTIQYYSVLTPDIYYSQSYGNIEIIDRDNVADTCSSVKYDEVIGPETGYLLNHKSNPHPPVDPPHSGKVSMYQNRG